MKKPDDGGFLLFACSKLRNFEKEHDKRVAKVVDLTCEKVSVVLVR